jgi:hypothetical protein
MNHYINLLEPSECYYLNSAEQNPLYKLGGVFLVVAFIGYNVFNYQKLQATVKEGEQIEQWLAENEATVEDAKDRIAVQLRIEQAKESLEGWKPSRFDYPRIFTALASSIPPPADQMQFLQLYFNETMIGMSTPRTTVGGGKGEFFPLERSIIIELRGKVAGSRPDLKLDAYRDRLNRLKDQLPLENITMRLRQSMEEKGPDGDMITVTPFSAEITLSPNVILP